MIIDDDGHGMKNQDVRQEYLKIASPRFSRKGERTPNLDQRTPRNKRAATFDRGLMHIPHMVIVTSKHLST